jgi:hypothetical protein
MTSKTGANTRIIVQGATTFGTAVAGGAGDKYEGQVSWDEGTESLRDNPIGSGADMDNASTQGATSPSVTLTGKARYENANTAAIALMFGADSIMNLGNGAFVHSFLYEANRTRSYMTIAFDALAGSTIELASCMPTRLTRRFENFPAYVEEVLEFVGNAVTYGSATNTSSSLDSATVAGTKRIVAKPADKFRINGFTAEALSDTYKQNIISAEVVYEYPLEFVREMKNSAGNGIPRSNGDPPFTVTLSLTYRSMDDHQFSVFKNAAADTQYKADITITGDLIGGSNYYSQQLFFPLLQVTGDPQYDLEGGGENPVTITFKALHAPSIPSGMLQRFPHERLINTVSTSYLP